MTIAGEAQFQIAPELIQRKGSPVCKGCVVPCNSKRLAPEVNGGRMKEVWEVSGRISKQCLEVSS